MATDHGATFLDALHRSMAAHEDIHASHRRRVAERAALHRTERELAAMIAERTAAQVATTEPVTHG